jgi:cytochrome c oxidase subunit III
MSTARTIDVSRLPTYAFSHRSLTWWGTMGMILIEGIVFVAAIVVYFYLRERVDQWPPVGEPPSLLWGTVNLGILLASALPNEWAKRRAQREDLRGVRIGLVAALLFSVGFLVVRALEYPALNTTYTGSAYGSIVFALLTLHTAHIVSDFIDSAVVTTLMFTGPLEGRRFVDVSETCLYWWFVVLSWIPIWFTIYIAPRLL